MLDSVADEYHKELVATAIKENIIAYLPRSTDRELISLRLVERHRIRNDISISNSLPKQLVAFLTPKKSTLTHYKHFFTSQLDVRLRVYAGGTESDEEEGVRVNIMSWDAIQWQRETAEVDVMLIAPTILQHVLTHHFCKPQDFSLVIIDECHDAVGKSPMALICDQLLRSIPPSTSPTTPGSPIQDMKPPAIFGMISAPISLNKGILVTKIRRLELTMNCRVDVSVTRKATPSGRDVMLMYSYDVLRFTPEQPMCPRGLHDGMCDGVNTGRRCTCWDRHVDVNSVPDAGDTFPKLNTAVPNAQALCCVFTAPVMVLYHAHLRLKFASNLAEMRALLVSHPHLQEQIRDLPVELTSHLSITSHIHAHSSTLKPFHMMLDRIIQTCQDSGVLGALFAVQAMFSPDLHTTSKSGCNNHANGTMKPKRPYGGYVADYCWGTAGGEEKDCGCDEEIGCGFDCASKRMKQLTSDVLSKFNTMTLSSSSSSSSSSSPSSPLTSISESDVVIVTSLFDMFASLAVMCGPQLCIRGLQFVNSNGCDDVEKQTCPVSWSFYLCQVLKHVANKSRNVYGDVLSLPPPFSSGSIGGVLECLLFDWDVVLEIDDLMQEIGLFCGVLLKGVGIEEIGEVVMNDCERSDDSDAMHGSGGVIGNATGKRSAVTEIEDCPASKRCKKKTNESKAVEVVDIHVDKKRKITSALDQRQRCSDRIEAPSDLCEEVTAFNHHGSDYDHALEIVTFPLLSSKSRALMYHLLSAHDMETMSTASVSVLQNEENERKSPVTTSFISSTTVFVKDNVTAATLNALLQTCARVLQTKPDHVHTTLHCHSLPASTFICETVSSYGGGGGDVGKTGGSIALDGKYDVIFTTDLAAERVFAGGDTAGSRAGVDILPVKRVVNYDSPPTVEVFRKRRGYSSSTGATVLSLFPTNLEGDLQVKGLSQFQQQETDARLCETRIDKTLDAFLSAVSQLDATRGDKEFDESVARGVSVGGSKITVDDAAAEEDVSLLNKVKNEKVADSTGKNFQNSVVKEMNEDNSNSIKTVIVKIVPDCLTPPQPQSSHPSTSSINHSPTLQFRHQDPAQSCHQLYQPVSVHLYALCSTASHSSSSHHPSRIPSCPLCSSYLEAANSCGMAFLQPVPGAVLAEAMVFGIRDSKLTVQLEYLGEKQLTESEMLAMQMFHRSVLCWETDDELDPSRMLLPLSSSTTVAFDSPMTVDEWVRSSRRAWYMLFPLMFSETKQDASFHFPLFSKNNISAKRLDDERRAVMSRCENNEWLRHLQACAVEATTLVDNLYQHQYRPDKVLNANDSTPAAQHPTQSEKTMKYPKMYSHTREDLIGQLFSRDKDYIFVGVEDVHDGGDVGPIVTFDDVMREGKKMSSSSNENETYEGMTYLEYFLSKGRISVDEVDTMRENKSHELIRATGVTARLSLVQILQNSVDVNSITSAPSVHNHSSSTHLLPSQCKALGRSRWYYCGLIQPTIIWKLQGLLLAMEVRTLISTDILSTVIVSGSTPQALAVHLINTSNVTDVVADTEESGIDLEGGNSVEYFDALSAPPLNLPSPNMVLTALTPRRALEMHDSERLEFLGKKNNYTGLGVVWCNDAITCVVHGDTVLKMALTWAVFSALPQAQEGDLTAARSDLISNANLSKRAKNTNLAPYLRAVLFSTGKQSLLYPPPGMRYLPAGASPHSSSDHVHYLRSLWNREINKSVKMNDFENSLREQVVLDSIVRAGSVASGTMETISQSLAPTDFLTNTPRENNIITSKKKKKLKPAVTLPSCQYITAEVKAKYLADMVEALVGVFYISGGILLAMGFLKGMNIWPSGQNISETVERDDSPDSTTGTIQSSSMRDRRKKKREIALTSKTQIRQYMTVDNNECTSHCTSSTLLTSKIVQHFTDTFQYTFRNPVLLQEALSCAVQAKNGEDIVMSYQRLEFLGDGVLDLAIIDLLYHAMPTAPQGELTDTKCSLINNKALGLIGQRLGLHMCLLACSSTLAQWVGDINCQQQMGSDSDIFDSIDRREKKEENSVERDHDYINRDDEVNKIIAIATAGGGDISNSTRVSDAHGLKILADVLEAVVGAVFIDSDCSLRTVQRLIRHVGIIPPGLLPVSH